MHEITVWRSVTSCGQGTTIHSGNDLYWFTNTHLMKRYQTIKFIVLHRKMLQENSMNIVMLMKIIGNYVRCNGFFPFHLKIEPSKYWKSGKYENSFQFVVPKCESSTLSERYWWSQESDYCFNENIRWEAEVLL